MERREDQGDVMFLFNTSEKLLVLNWLETNFSFLYHQMRHLYLTTLYLHTLYLTTLYLHTLYLHQEQVLSTEAAMFFLQ